MAFSKAIAKAHKDGEASNVSSSPAPDLSCMCSLASAPELCAATTTCEKRGHVREHVPPPTPTYRCVSLPEADRQSFFVLSPCCKQEEGLTREDIDKDLDAHAERKRLLDEEKARKAGQAYKHVSRSHVELRTKRKG